MKLMHAFQKFKRRKGIVILAYHRICEETGLFYDFNISATPNGFRKQMEYIKSKYNVISGSELVAYFSRKAGIPDNAIMITFDDGFKDTIENAFPVLRDMQLPAIVFIANNFIDGQYIPWEDEIAYLINVINPNTLNDELIFQTCKMLRGASQVEKEAVLENLYKKSKVTKGDVRNRLITEKKNMMNMNDLNLWVSAGLEVGSHTLSHPQLSKISNEKAEIELRSSKLQLEELIGKEVAVFAYPFGMNGYYNQDSIRLVKETGYKCAVSLIGSINTLKTNRYDLRRIPVVRNTDFMKLCQGVVR